MGTHPIFESDFDCLTERICFLNMSDTEIDLTKKKKKKGSKLIPEDLGGDQRAQQDAAANEELFGAADGTQVDTSKFDDDTLGETFLGGKKKKKKKKLEIEEVDDDDQLVEEIDDL